VTAQRLPVDQGTRPGERPAGAITEDEWSRAVTAIAAAAEVCLACHVQPDGDALGSMLAVAQALQARHEGRQLGLAPGERSERPPGQPGAGDGRQERAQAGVIASFDGQPFGVPRILRFLPGTGLLRPPGQFPAQPQVMVTFDAASPDRLGSGLVWTTVTRQDRGEHGLALEAAESVIDVVRRTDEADVAIVLKQDDDGQWHVSARSKGITDVGSAAAALGGGGHRLAAGFTASGTADDVMAALRGQLGTGAGVPSAPGEAPAADGAQ
jgi:DHHA1 domain